MDNVGIVLITFNPDIKQFSETIKKLLLLDIKILIVDNNSQNISLIDEICEDNNSIMCIKNSENFGIAKASNIGFQYFKDLGIKWVLYLDQDSNFPNSGLLKYQEFLEKYQHSFNIGMLTPIYIEKNEASHKFIDESEFSFVNFPIASGTFVNVSAWQNIGKFDENLFIDRVDDDFDLRLREAGFKLIQLNDVFMPHTIGDIKEKNFFGIKVKVFNHSAFRKFYLARNNVIYFKKHGGLYEMMKREILLLIRIILFESEKISKLFAFFKGLTEGIRFQVKV